MSPSQRTRTLTATAVVALAATAFGVTGAAALDTGTLRSRSVPILPSVAGLPDVEARGDVRLPIPTTWTARTLKRSLSITKRGTACTYRVSVRADYVLGDRGADTVPLVAAAAPADGPYLLDEGTRGSAAWRVTRVRDTERTRIRAVRLAPSSITAGPRAPLPAGKQVYARTVVTAIDGVRDECHTGTYRNSLAPSLGDALAAQKGRGFLVATG